MFFSWFVSAHVLETAASFFEAFTSPIPAGIRTLRYFNETFGCEMSSDSSHHTYGIWWWCESVPKRGEGGGGGGRVAGPLSTRHCDRPCSCTRTNRSLDTPAASARWGDEMEFKCAMGGGGVWAIKDSLTWNRGFQMWQRRSHAPLRHPIIFSKSKSSMRPQCRFAGLACFVSFFVSPALFFIWKTKIDAELVVRFSGLV